VFSKIIDPKNIFFVLFFLQWTRVLFVWFPSGKLFSIFLLFLIIANRKKLSLVDLKDLTFIVFIVTAIFGVLVALFRSINLLNIIIELFQVYIPAVFAIIVFRKRDIIWAMSSFIYLNLATIIVSFLLFITQPYFYREYLNVIESTGTHILLTSNFFRSIFGLTLTGTFSMVSIIFLPSIKLNAILKVLMLCVFVGSILLAGRRSALLLTILLIFYRLIQSRAGFFLLASLTLLGLYTIPFVDTLSDSERLLDVVGAFEERTGNWQEGFQQLTLLGNGISSAGHNAPEGVFTVPDNWFLKYSVEFGLLSLPTFLLFFSITIFSVLFKENKLSKLVVSLMLMQSLGSDILGFTYASLIFWVNLNSCEFNGNKSYAIID
jgi:hypothetical protein